MLLILFTLYNNIYIGNNYVSYDKYKSTIKKYKIYISSLEHKLSELEKLNQKSNQSLIFNK